MGLESPSLSAEDLQRVLRILRSTSGHLQPRALYQAIVEAIPRELGGFHIVNLALVFPATERLVTVAMSGDDARAMSDAYGGLLTQPIDTGIMGWVARNGKCYYAPNAPEDPLYFTGMEMAPRPGSELALPVKVDDETVAVLNLESRMADAFSPPMIAMLEVLADHLGMSIQNALLHEQVQEETEQLQGALARLRTTEGAFAAIVSGLARRAWLLDASGRVESEVRVSEARVAFRPRVDGRAPLAEEMTPASRVEWDQVFLRAVSEGKAGRMRVEWRDGAADVELRIFPIPAATAALRQVLVICG